MKALDSWLKAKNTTQTAFAKSVGVSQATISDIINGKHNASVKLLKRIAKKTGLTIDRLLSSETH